jgi:hypothetical protein
MRQEISFNREERDPVKEERELEAYLDALHMMNAAEKVFRNKAEEEDE